MTMQAQIEDPRGWTIHRNRRGWPCWYQRWLEAWWVLTGEWSLHRAWQGGVAYGAMTEYTRIVQNGGDLYPIMREVVDVTWGRALEDGSVPSSKIVTELVATAWRQQRERGSLQQKAGTE